MPATGTVVEFHTLAADSDAQRLRGACRLVEKAYLEGLRVLVWLDDEASLSAFDNLLWTFGDRSFVPHEPLAAEPAACEAPVQLTAAAALPPATLAAGFDVLCCLRARGEAAALRFNRVLEVVDAEPSRREAGRQRFRFYREQGVAPQHFELPARA
jgi:DNA polymerase III subunit chi